jgi:membrane protein
MQRSTIKFALCQPIAVLVKQTVSEWLDDGAPRLAAALAFYTILSAAPLLVLSVAVAGLVFEKQAAQGQLAWEIQNFVGGDAAQAIQNIIRSAHRPSAGLIATVLSSVSLIVGASSVVVELRGSLNLIWGVRPQGTGTVIMDVFVYLKKRFYSSLVVIAAGCLLLVSLLMSTLIAALGVYVEPLLPTSEWILHGAAFVISFVVITLLFAAIYKLFPDVRLQWRDVMIGASVASLLLTIGKQFIAIYLGRVGLESTYGAAWATVLFLLWVYYSAQLFFLGAEFTKTYARMYGSHASQKTEPVPR